MSCGSFARSLTKRSTGGDVQVEGKKRKLHWVKFWPSQKYTLKRLWKLFWSYIKKSLASSDAAAESGGGSTQIIYLSSDITV